MMSMEQIFKSIDDFEGQIVNFATNHKIAIFHSDKRNFKSMEQVNQAPGGFHQCMFH